MTLKELQKQALETNDLTALMEFMATPEYKALPYTARNDGFVTSHKLKEFRRCGFCYQKKYVDGLISPIDAADDKDALILGQAFDDLVTNGPEAFSGKYEVVSRRGKEPQKVQLTQGMYDSVRQLTEEFTANPLFAQQYQKKVMVAIYAGMLLKIEMDGYDPQNAIIRDIKTCANITKFSPSYYTFQASFYHFVVEEVTGQKCQVFLDVVDKYDYFARSACFSYSRTTLEAERGQIIAALEDLRTAEELNLYLPATDQNILWNCPFYSFNGHGRPSGLIIF